MKTLLTFFKLFIVGTWLLGIFVPDQRPLLWAWAAGWGAGTLIAEFYFEWRRSHIRINQVMLDNSNMPPELKEKMEDFIKLLIKTNPQNTKCDDPHCPNCWGLGDEK